MALQRKGAVADSVTSHISDWTTVLQYPSRSLISLAEGSSRTRKQGSQVVCFYSLAEQGPG